MTSDFAEQLKTWREERGVTQSGLAQFLGISRQAMYNWEHSRGGITKSHRRLLTYALRYYDIEHGRAEKAALDIARDLRKIADQIERRAEA